MIQVGDFIHKNFQVTHPYVGVNLIRKKLISHSAIVVLEEDTNDYLGVLTPLDIVQRQHNLVIDCLIKKPILQYECKVEEALAIMHKHNTEVLPVENHKKFEGLVFKDDLVTSLSSQNTNQGNQLQRNAEEIKKSEKILTAIYNSTHSVRLLVAPDYTILFFNKTAYETTILFQRKKLKIGDNFMNYAKDILKTTDSSLKSVFETALTGEYVIREDEIRHNDSSLWVKTEYNPVYIDNKLIGVSISSRDISERKKNEFLIKKQIDAFKDIVTFQSHEVRRPVANIFGIINSLDRSTLSEKNRELIELLDITTKQLDDIIKAVVTKAYDNSKEEE
ncbi:MAG: PAS domain S-box protein [Chitinophagaceae bacterium]|nr:PAS domain S-box protein [Chitinophagaceae bacterium]